MACDAVLSTERLCLVAGSPAIAAAWAAYQYDNREHLAPWNPLQRPEAFDVSATRLQLQRSADERSAGRRYDFGIFFPSEPETMVGQVTLSDVVRGVFQACYLGYSLAAGAQGKGVMTEALRAVIAFAFDDLRLHRIMANYMPRNARSAAVLERLGFTIEGRAKDYLFIAGAWEDHVLTSLRNPAFTWNDPA